MKWVWITIKEVGSSSNQLSFESPHPPAAILALVHKWGCSCKRKKKMTQFFFQEPWCRNGSSFSINFKNMYLCVCAQHHQDWGYSIIFFFLSWTTFNNAKANLLLGQISWHKWNQSLWSLNILPHQNGFPCLLSPKVGAVMGFSCHPHIHLKGKHERSSSCLPFIHHCCHCITEHQSRGKEVFLPALYVNS